MTKVHSLINNSPENFEQRLARLEHMEHATFGEVKKFTSSLTDSSDTNEDHDDSKDGTPWKYSHLKEVLSLLDPWREELSFRRLPPNHPLSVFALFKNDIVRCSPCVQTKLGECFRCVLA